MTEPMNFVAITEENGRWQQLMSDWENQCLQYGEDFETYLTSPFSVLKPLAIDQNNTEAAIYGLEDNRGFHAICQVNRAGIPGYVGKVLRVRMMYFAPSYDLGEHDIDAYASVLIKLFVGVVNLSENVMPAPHIKFHLRSPADRQFFAAFGSMLDKEKTFKFVDIKGAWLYISK